MEPEDIIKHINKKLNALSTAKKLIVLVLMLMILGAIFYMTTLTQIETVEYTRNGVTQCTEIYVDGVLNTSPCTEYYPKTAPTTWPTNNTQLKIFENLILNQNQS